MYKWSSPIIRPFLDKYGVEKKKKKGWNIPVLIF